MKIITKFEAAVSDTDILIDLYRTGTLDLLKIDESIEYFKDNKYVKILKLENAIT